MAPGSVEGGQDRLLVGRPRGPAVRGQSGKGGEALGAAGSEEALDQRGAAGVGQSAGEEEPQVVEAEGEVGGDLPPQPFESLSDGVVSGRPPLPAELLGEERGGPPQVLRGGGGVGPVGEAPAEGAG